MLDFLTRLWKNVYGMYRMALSIGFIGCIKGLILPYPDVKLIHYKGFDFPMIGEFQNDAEYLDLLENDLAKFETRDDDIFVVAYAKSGHHWSYDFIMMLLKGELKLDNNAKESAFLEMLLGFSKSFKKLAELPSPRVIFTHYPADYLPLEVFEKKRKIVRLIRNPKDVCVSAFHHQNNEMPGQKWNEFVDDMILALDGKKMKGNNYFAHPDWCSFESDSDMKMNHLDHTIVLHYEDLKDDMMTQLKRLSKFLDRDYDDVFLSQVAAKTNLAYVKKNKDTSMTDSFLKQGSLYRKGVIGDWRHHFTVSQNQRMDEILKRKMKDSVLMKNVRFLPRDS